MPCKLDHSVYGFVSWYSCNGCEVIDRNVCVLLSSVSMRQALDMIAACEWSNNEITEGLLTQALVIALEMNEDSDVARSLIHVKIVQRWWML
jgi:hypothetical protein